jgi:phosphotransferase system HPr (HPr) family protein
VKSAILQINNDVGLHARPAALFIQIAQRFQSDIQIKYGNREGNAKSLLSVLGLGVGQGSEILVEARGEDANQALEALSALVESNFGEVKS